MKKKIKKRKISKIWMVIIFFIFTVFLIFTSILLYDSVKNIKQLKKIRSSINIPSGFYYVGGDIDTGVVISDNKNDELKGTKFKDLSKIEGNQFVWIPVENAVVDSFDEAKKLIENGKNPIAFKDKDNYYGIVYAFDIENHSYTILKDNFSKEFSFEPYVIKSIFLDDNDNYKYLSSEELYQKKFNKMVEQVEKNKGFYISRFEIGNLSNAIVKKEKVVSKAGEDDITYQNWIDLYKALKEMYNRDDITTEMIWGCQWDAALVWMLNTSTLSKYVYNSKEIGNYYNKLEKTGSSPNYCINNIYDMAGNVCEWTQRSSMNGGRIASGGSNNTDETQNYSLCNRKVYEITSPWKEVGTRMTMYVN